MDDIIGIRCLDWKPFWEHEAVKAAYDDLKQISGRTIALHSCSLIPRAKNPLSCGWSGAFHVFIPENSPLANHSLVHELLHGILIEEGYYKVAGRFPERFNMQSILSNDMQHPEIFDRMSTYGLEMSDYWTYWVDQLSRGFDSMKRYWDDPIAGFTDFPHLYTWLFVQNLAGPYLEEYGAHNHSLYEAVQAAYEKTKDIGFSDATAQRESLLVFRNDWLQFCKGHLPDSSDRSTLSRCIEESKLKRIFDYQKDRPAEEIISLLLRYGLRRT